MKPIWNVIYNDFNRKEITHFNIFNHSSFYKTFKDIKLIKDKSGFEKELHNILRYYFWSKCEWEVVICGWPNQEVEEKWDVYSQIEINWDIFVDYCWNVEVD